ncbi:MAG: heme ABC exporter ATP-binding protein CcmA [OCS116 cluster bacterium]|uniref:Heme ABC exporter ATP-binding protein CcmA n=1 Tax=OCS116 cluster bacterium TaxID=2030921 RepID=A0A2A4Z1P8_9PROT|nr:heme ABC exporter ATP-binding protein CcmA [OCS116 cluster bacterium]
MKINRINIQNLSAQKGERLLFEDIGFELKAGQCLLLKGPNGSGKTTLLHMLAGADQPRSGDIDIYTISSGDQPRLDGVIGISHFITHQDGLKKSLTVLENLTFWTEYMGGDKDRIDTALATVGLEPMPHILAARLSAGQKKRLMLARLLTISHPLWLLDEPSVSLDDDGQKLLTKLMQEHISAGGILIASTHLPLGIEFDQTLNLTGGRYMFNDDYLLEEENI